MSSTIQISNRLERLLDELCHQLAARPGSAFCRRIVIVSSRAVRQWLLYRLAEQTRLGVVAGVQVVFLEPAIHKIVGGFVPSPMELALRLEGEIRAVRNAPHSDLWDPLWKMLKVEGAASWDLRSQRRLTHLTEHVARLFVQYGLYGGQWLEDWETHHDGDWQQALWKKVFGEGEWGTLGHRIRHFLQNPEPLSLGETQIHLFGISHLCPLQAAFFRRVEEAVPCHFYVLSPCQLFWGDLVSDREKRHLQAFWERRGVAEGQMRELELYLRDRNPILANFGRLGREFHALLEDVHASPEACYEISQSMAEEPVYAQSLLPDCRMVENSNRLSLLEAVQADLLFLRNPESQGTLSLQHYDGSIQIHRATSKWREVEILHDRILGLMHERKHLECGDILIMAPNITDYVPYIRTVFDPNHSPLPYQIMDVGLEVQSPYYRGVSRLLDLAYGRWDIASLIELFEHPYLQHRFGIAREESLLLREWAEQAGIKWGFSKEHRDEVLFREGCANPLLEATEAASWQEGLKRLLLGLAVRVDEGNEEEMLQWERLPVDGVEGTNGELVGKLVQLVTSLRKDLKILHDGTCQTLREWVKTLKDLLESYFSVPHDDGKGYRDQQQVWSDLASMERERCSLEEMTFPFDTVCHHLKASWMEASGALHESSTGVVRFCSLLPMRSIPAKVVWLMGMDEGAFPRKDTGRSLNLMAQQGKGDYCPSRGDYDRYLFLEALLSAREVLGMSYQGYSWKDSREVPPSLLVAELSDYLKAGFSFGEAGFGEGEGWFKHPFFSFAPENFGGQGVQTSYSSLNFRLAAAALQPREEKRRRFFPNLHERPVSKKEPGPFLVNLKDLRAMASNPVKAFVNSQLGMYLPREEALEGDESLALSHLEKFQIRRHLLKTSLNAVWHFEERQGRTPWGVLKEVAKGEVTGEAQKIQDFLKAQGIRKDAVFQVQFARNLRRRTQLGEHLIGLPALSVTLDDQRQVFLEGILPDVCEKGLLFSGKDNDPHRWKVWPLYLVFCLAIERCGLPWEPSLFLMREPKKCVCPFDNAEDRVKAYLSLYLDSCETVSPLLPEWIPLWKKGDPDKLFHKIKQDLSGNEYSHFFNDYAIWAWDVDEFPWPAETLDYWRGRLKSVW